MRRLKRILKEWSIVSIFFAGKTLSSSLFLFTTVLIVGTTSWIYSPLRSEPAITDSETIATKRYVERSGVEMFESMDFRGTFGRAGLSLLIALGSYGAIKILLWMSIPSTTQTLAERKQRESITPPYRAMEEGESTDDEGWTHVADSPEELPK